MVNPEHQLEVQIAARALANANLAHAYGHCSLRLDDSHFLVCAAKPMAMIGPKDEGTVVPVFGDLPPGVLGEVSIHQQIYANRPEVNGVCRTMPPQAMALSTLGRTPLPRHGMGSYFAPEIPLWDDPQLVRSQEQALAVVETMSSNPAVVMRGNGVVTAGQSLREAVVLCWYLEDAARIELLVLASGQPGKVLSPDEAEKRAIRSGAIFERMWDYLTFGEKGRDE